MRAPFSKRAKEILDNPEAARQLQDWLDSGEQTAQIKLITQDGGPKRVQVRKAGTMHIVRGEEPYPKHWLNTFRGYISRLLRTFD